MGTMSQVLRGVSWGYWQARCNGLGTHEKSPDLCSSNIILRTACYDGGEVELRFGLLRGFGASGKKLREHHQAGFALGLNLNTTFGS